MKKYQNLLRPFVMKTSGVFKFYEVPICDCVRKNIRGTLCLDKTICAKCGCAVPTEFELMNYKKEKG